jgi:hypothetical protein
MANQITPAELLQVQLHDWNLLLAQLEQNPDTSAADVAYCQAKVQQINGEIQPLSN